MKESAKKRIFSGIIFLGILFLFIQNGYGKDLFFPVFQNIYISPENNGPAKLYSKTEWLIFSITAEEKNSILIGKRGNQASVLKIQGKGFKTLLSGDYGDIVADKNSILTVGNFFKERAGFTFRLFLNMDGIKPVARPFTLDLFLSDFSASEKGFYISGSDQNDLSNRLYVISEKSEKKLLLSLPKEKNFMKIIQAPGVEICYLSTLPGKSGSKMVWIINDTADQKNKVNRVELNVPGNMDFYGKGFYFEGNLYIPLIDNQFNTYLGRYTYPDLKTSEVLGLPNGFYQLIRVENNILAYLGYNYYKSKASFQYIVYDL